MTMSMPETEALQRAAAQLALCAWTRDMDRVLAKMLATSAFDEQTVFEEFASNPPGEIERECGDLFDQTMERLVSKARAALKTKKACTSP